MKTPIFVFDGYAVDIFNSIFDLESKIEIIDIKEENFEFFDSQGNLLKFEIIQEPYKWLGFFNIHRDKIKFVSSYPDKEQFIEKIKNVYYQTFQKYSNDLSLYDMEQQLISFYGFAT